MQSLAPKAFPSIDALLQSLPSDDAMRTRYSGFHNIQTAPAKRVQEEKLVVTVVGQLVAVKFEDARQPGGDNDFHLIVASSGGHFMNMEVSGLPRAGDPEHQFQSVRSQLLSILRTVGISPTTRYQKPSNTLLVRITGSLYFDGDHEPETVGPTGARPNTVWEIHPVQDIQVFNG